MIRSTPEYFNSGVPLSEAEIVGHLFAEAMQRMRQMVLHPKGMKQSSQEFRQARAAQQIEQVDQILTRLRRQTSGWIGRTIPEVVRLARQRANQQAIEAGVRREQVFRGGFDLIDERTVVVFARDIYADLNKAAESMGERTKSLLRRTAQVGLSERDIDTILAGGVIDGTPRETIKALREELQRVHGDAVEINGRNYNVRDYAELVVRTKTREATVIARHERLEEIGLDLVAITGRISNNPCTAFLGQIFSLSGKHPKYPAYSMLPNGGPPFHPNCSKSTRPIVPEMASSAQLRAGEPDEDVAKLLGKPFGQIGKIYKDLQIRQQVEARYGTTEKRLYAA